MLSRMIARLMFRAVLSLGMLLGVASYGHYLSGGDPGALWKRVAGGALGGVGDSLSGMRDAVTAPAAAVAGGGSGGSGGGRRESVFTWQDADGVTHYATERPTGIDAVTVTVDPDTNVLAPVVAPAPRETRRAAGVDGGMFGGARGEAVRSVPGRGGERARPSDRYGASGGDEAGEPMPGIAGAVLRARGDAPAPDPAQAEALLRMLQSPAR